MDTTLPYFYSIFMGTGVLSIPTYQILGMCIPLLILVYAIATAITKNKKEKNEVFVMLLIALVPPMQILSIYATGIWSTITLITILVAFTQKSP